MTTYDRSPEFDQDPETQVLPPALDSASEALTQITRGELDSTQRFAIDHPRPSIALFRKSAMAMVTNDPQTADECIYALPRAGKTIEGPSARFAEILAYCWRNNRSGARPIMEDAEFVVCQGVFHDLETNMQVTTEVKRRITDSKGRRYNADMVGTTTNAGCSIARRNAILGAIPKSIWSPIYEAARQVVAGDVKTLANRRDAAIKAFAKFGIKPEQIFKLLEVNGVEEISGDHLVTLRGVLTAIREGEVTPELAFAPKDTQDQNLADKSAAGVQRIKDRYSKTPEAQPRIVESGTEQARVASPEAPSQNAPVQAVAAEQPVRPESVLPQEQAPAPQADHEPEPLSSADLLSRCEKHGEYSGDSCPECERENMGVPGLFDAEHRAEPPAPSRHRDDG